jgi:hypothetical protein
MTILKFVLAGIFLNFANPSLNKKKEGFQANNKILRNEKLCSSVLHSVTNNSSAGVIWNLKFTGCTQTFSNPVRILSGQTINPNNGFTCPNKTITVKVVGPFNHIDLFVNGGTLADSQPYDVNTPSGVPGYYTFFIDNCVAATIVLN